MCSRLTWAVQFAVVNLMAGFLNICVLLFIFFKEISQSCRWLAHLQIPLQGTMLVMPPATELRGSMELTYWGGLYQLSDLF